MKYPPDLSSLLKHLSWNCLWFILDQFHLLHSISIPKSRKTLDNFIHTIAGNMSACNVFLDYQVFACITRVPTLLPTLVAYPCNLLLIILLWCGWPQYYPHKVIVIMNSLNLIVCNVPCNYVCVCSCVVCVFI